MDSIKDKIEKLKASLEALEEQRSFFGDAAVDLSRKAILEEIAALEKSTSGSLVEEGERRQATILFSELSGYSSLKENLDPELIDRIKEDAIQIVERNGGTINQFFRDKIVALFGIPTARENDPVLAVKVGLELHEMVKILNEELTRLKVQTIVIHSSINSGWTETASKKEEGDSLYSLSGDTLNIGSALLNISNENEILLSSETQKLIAPFFRTESLDPIRINGKKKPLVPYRVLGKTNILSKIDLAKERGFTPFIEREAELSVLQDRLSKVRQGRGQFVTIKGEAGIA